MKRERERERERQTVFTELQSTPSLHQNTLEEINEALPTKLFENLKSTPGNNTCGTAMKQK